MFDKEVLRNSEHLKFESKFVSYPKHFENDLVTKAPSANMTLTGKNV